MSVLSRIIVVSGYYGFGNAGDEAILAALVRSLEMTGTSVVPVVLSATPEDTSRQHGVVSIFRYNLPAIARVLRACSAFISGGGTLLQDATSARSMLYYLGLLHWAQRWGKPTFVYAQGIGPVRSGLYRVWMRRVLRRATYISVRDRRSAALLRALGVPSSLIDVVADPVLLLEPAPSCRATQILQQEGLRADIAPIIIAPRPTVDQGRLLAQLAAAADRLAEEGYPIWLMPMQPAVDTAVCHWIRERMRHPATILSGDYRPEDLLALMKYARLVIGIRLHAVIMAVNVGVPVIGLSYDPKVDGFFEEVGRMPLVPIHAVSGAWLVHQALSILRNWDENRRWIEGRRDYLRKRALRPAQVIAAYLS